MGTPTFCFLRKNDVRIEEIPYAELTLNYRSGFFDFKKRMRSQKFFSMAINRRRVLS
ncbi:hypothetical protein LEP1GSC070_1824 [Leptospira santarosai str. AIM]|nr:hypothetical protein LEP1GSC070_1824 [Leptospira santarosai str. AIM]